MKLSEQLNVIEAKQKVILEASSQEFDDLPIGKRLIATPYDEKLENFIDVEILSICVGPHDSLLIKI